MSEDADVSIGPLGCHSFTIKFLLVATLAIALLFAFVSFVRTPSAESRLLKAAERGDIKVVESLLRDGVDPSSRDSWGGSPMMYASVNGHAEIVRALLDAGASVNERSRMGRTPLMWAAKAGNLDVVRSLLDRGANTRLADDEGNTAAKLATKTLRQALEQSIERSNEMGTGSEKLPGEPG